MNVEIIPAKLSGTIKAISSKSDVHRLLICASLSDKPTEILLSGSMNTDRLSDDIKATDNCLSALGAEIAYSGTHCITVTPVSNMPESPVLNCKESGSTLRFMLPVAAALLARTENTGKQITFTGEGRLPDRPLSDLTNALKAGGIHFSAERLPFTISGTLGCNPYYLPGNVSSQYITGLLLGLASLGEKGKNESATNKNIIEINLTSALQSAAYVDITTSAMKKFGIDVQRVKSGTVTSFIIPADSKYKSPGKVQADGDWSNAAFFLALSALSAPAQDVKLTELSPESKQGDKKIAELTQAFIANKAQNEPFEISLAEIPDLLPILAVIAAFSDNGAVFTDGERLRMKESDRLKTVCLMINGLGGNAEETQNGLIVKPRPLTGGQVESFNDHRIVMAAAIAASRCKNPVLITGAEAVNKSYPTFFEDYKTLGGVVNVI